MSYLIRTTRRRLTAGLSAAALLTGGISTSILLTGGTAEAAGCTAPELAGTSCTITGTLTMTAGTLSMTMPSALGWTETMNGLDQHLVDTTPADQTYQVNDATGSGAGWHVTTAATTFTSGADTLADTGTFATNGSTSSMTSATAPTDACTGGSTCTLPDDSAVTYPVAITTAATAPTPVNIYDASATTGLGTITIGSVGWWLNVPSNTIQGTYVSTVSLELVSGP